MLSQYVGFKYWIKPINYKKQSNTIKIILTVTVEDLSFSVFNSVSSSKKKEYKVNGGAIHFLF